MNLQPSRLPPGTKPISPATGRDGTITITASGGNRTLSLYAESRFGHQQNRTIYKSRSGNLQRECYRCQRLRSCCKQHLVINEPAPLVITSLSATDITCNNANNGTNRDLNRGDSADDLYTQPCGNFQPDGYFHSLRPVFILSMPRVQEPVRR